MSKAILVIDMPERCNDCPAVNGGLNGVFCKAAQKQLQPKSDIPVWCPLVPMPEKKEVCGRYPQADGITPSYKVGWNDAIDAIGGKESE